MAPRDPLRPFGKAIGSAMVSTIRSAWIFLAVIFYELNLDQYVEANKIGIAPKYWWLLFLVSGVLLIPKIHFWNRIIGNPLMAWLICYLAISMLWFLLSSNFVAAGIGFTLVLTTVLLTLIALIAFRGMQEDPVLISAAFALALIVGVLSVIWELFDPGAFFDVGRGIIGRPAGFYLNPNSAGLAFIMLMMVLLPRVNRKLAVVISLIALIGVTPTFSRASLIAWPVVVLLASWYGFLPRVSGLIIGGTIFTAWIMSDLILNAFLIVADPSWTDSIDRLRWILGAGDISDVAAEDRRGIAQTAFGYIANSPIYGNGLGFTFVWAEDLGTHNLMLRHMVEYGLLGMFAFPSLLLCIYKLKEYPVSGQWLIATFVLMLLLSVFSHNMLEQGFFILPLVALTLSPQNSNRQAGVAS